MPNLCLFCMSCFHRSVGRVWSCLLLPQTGASLTPLAGADCTHLFSPPLSDQPESGPWCWWHREDPLQIRAPSATPVATHLLPRPAYLLEREGARGWEARAVLRPVAVGGGVLVPAISDKCGTFKADLHKWEGWWGMWPGNVGEWKRDLLRGHPHLRAGAGQVQGNLGESHGIHRDCWERSSRSSEGWEQLLCIQRYTKKGIKLNNFSTVQSHYGHKTSFIHNDKENRQNEILQKCCWELLSVPELVLRRFRRRSKHEPYFQGSYSLIGLSELTWSKRKLNCWAVWYLLKKKSCKV